MNRDAAAPAGPHAPRTPKLGASEATRLAAVDRTGVLQPQRRREPPLQHVVETAAREFQVPVALISIIGRQREFFAASVGTDIDDVPKADALCLHAVRSPGEVVVSLNTRDDKRFATNPFVTGPPFICFYAGVPLLDGGGYALGALCIIDLKVHASEPSLFHLLRLAREAEHILAR